MKKLILLGLVLTVALIGFYSFMPNFFISPSSDLPKKFSSYEELNSFVRENSQSGYGLVPTASDMGAGAAEKSAHAQSVSESVQSSAQRSSDYSQTNIQVQGVDEADIVKTDGKHIYAVSGSKVIILDAHPAENAKIISQIETNGSVNEIFINNDRLVVFGQKSYEYAISQTKNETGVVEIATEPAMMPRYYSPRTFIEIYDISDKSGPSLARNVSIDGNYYDSRMTGDYVYVIANQPVYNYGGGPAPLPAIYSGDSVREMPATDIYYFDVPDNSFIFTNILSINTQSGDFSTKTFLMGYTQSMYVSTDNIYITYPKRASELRYYDRIIDEIIIPVVPSDIQSKISVIKNSNSSKHEKMREIGNVFEDYLRTMNPEQAADAMRAAEEKAAILQREIAKEMEKTVVHKIFIDNGKIEYKTNGEVPGQALNQFSMDEHNGYFRIATTTSGGGWGVATESIASGTMQMPEREIPESLKTTATQVSQKMVQDAAESSMACPAVCVPLWTMRNNECVFNSCGSGCGPNNITSFSTETECKLVLAAVTAEEKQKRTAPQPAQSTVAPSGPQNHVYVLDESLKIVGKLEDLAPGERIYSARFMGDKAYMVTFRQTDPLFVIDLSNSTSPAVLGYLKIPGVSDYLHPYDETHIIGVGRDATEEGRIKGMKLSLFDVSDVANPTEVSKYMIGDRGTDSEALRDHKAFLFSREKNLLAVPVSEYNYTPIVGMPEWQWENKYWQGAYVFNLDLVNGFVLKGKITHQNNTENSTYYYDWNSQIRRSLFIENVLYTLSSRMIKMNSLADLAEINKIELPYQTEYPYVVY